MSEIPKLARELDLYLFAPLVRKYSQPPPEIVHYTSVEALKSILSSGNLRMSHFRYLNDSTEMLHGRGSVNELLQAEVQRQDTTSPFFDFCRLAFNEQDDNAIQYFVSSFSDLADSSELWSRYGDRGAGVAITFDTKRMGADVSEPFPYFIGRVTYTPAEQAELLSQFVEGAKSVLGTYVGRYGYDVRDVMVQILAAKLCSHLNHHSIALKNEKWSVEREWRTVFSLLRNDTNERKALVAVRPDGRPYVDVSVRSVEPDEVRMPITAVTVGTSADRRMIRSTLDGLGYRHVEVIDGT